MKIVNVSTSVCLCVVYFLFGIAAARGQTETFNYKKSISDQLSTLVAYTDKVDLTTGQVTISGGDSQRPTTPFTFIWGDNTSTNGFFPQTHTYATPKSNYLAKVVANYPDNKRDTVDVLVGFTKPVITPIAIDPKLRVYIPSSPIKLSAHHYSPPSTLSAFTDDFFTGRFSRSDLEYILSVIGTVEYDFVNNNTYQFDGKFEQFVLRDANAGGGYSLWFTDPVAFGAGDALISNTDFSSMAHEMGHNITLNTPAQFIYGGKIDGNANAIFSETLAQIFQHAAGYELVNRAGSYGFDAEIVFSLRKSFVSSFGVLKRFHQQYVADGKRFFSWNDPATSGDEALPTFMTIAYKFCEYAEQQNLGYRLPTKRLMAFLQRFNADWQKRYNQYTNNPTADAFRATLMVAALSHAFQKDLRADFRALNFPISDEDFAYLNPDLLSLSVKQITVNAVSAAPVSVTVTSTSSWTAVSSQPWLTLDAGTGTGNRVITLTASDNQSLSSRSATVAVSSPGFINQIITVNQAGAQPTLGVSVTALTVDATSVNPLSVNVTSNTSWSVTSSQPWLTVDKSLGTGNQTVAVTVSPNASVTSRTAILTFLASGVTSKTLVITQAGAGPSLAVSATDVMLTADGRQTASVDITSNTDWTVSGTQSWLTITPSAGSGSLKIVIAATANTATQIRSATLVVSGGGVPRQIVVQQQGAIITALEDPITNLIQLYPNPVSNELLVEGIPVGYEIVVYDMLGRVAVRQVTEKKTVVIDVGHLTAGSYFVEAKGQNQTVVRRFIKMPCTS